LHFKAVVGLEKLTSAISQKRRQIELWLLRN